jgi:hypothetical protein
MNSYGHPTSTASVKKFNDEVKEKRSGGKIITDSENKEKEHRSF